MPKRMLIMWGVVALVLGGILFWQLLVKPAMMRKFIPVGVIPPQTVSTARAEFTEWQGEFQAVGTLRAVRGADIAPEVPGVIIAIHFQSGQAVGAGGAPGSLHTPNGPGGGQVPPRPPLRFGGNQPEKTTPETHH